MKPRILIIGANGQIGTDLGHALAARYGADAVVLSDIAAQRSLPRGACHTADASSATTTSCTAATEAEAAATAADFTTRHLQQRRA